MNSEQRWIGMCREYDQEGKFLHAYKLVEIVYENGARKRDEQYYHPDGKPDYRYHYEYRDGVLLEQKMYLDRDLYHGSWLYGYSDGRLQSRTWIDKSGNEKARERFVFASDGRSAVRTRENIGEWRHEWDERGREIRITGAPYSGGYTETTYAYDESGYLLAMKRNEYHRCEVTFTRECSSCTSS